MNSHMVGRLAPSPTGAQHLGNARTYLLAWLSARSRGGRVLLRIEDIDSPRVQPGAARQAMDDLRWLGLDWDEGPVIQSERLPAYEAVLRRLQARELVYPCTCTRGDIERAASAPHAEHEGPVYPAPAPAAAWRMPPALLLTLSPGASGFLPGPSSFRTVSAAPPGWTCPRQVGISWSGSRPALPLTSWPWW